MRRVIHFYVVLLLCCLFCLSAKAQEFNPDDIVISVLTCDPGDEIYSMYGHNALRIIDRKSETDIVYNWGTFNFDEPGFLIKFMRGKLNYNLNAEHIQDFLPQYNYFKRGVIEQRLFLDSLQKIKILQAVATNMLPENRGYKYDFFMDNCATRIRDIIMNNVSNLNWPDSLASHKTFRQIIKEYQKERPWTDFGIDLIIGARADRQTTKAEETFIPDYLSRSLDHIHYKDVRLSRIGFRETTILKFPERTPSSFSKLWNPYIIIGLLLFWEIWLFVKRKEASYDRKRRITDRIWSILLFIVSIIMIVMWFWTDHVPTKDNWNLLWASPLWLAWCLSKKQAKTFGIVLILGLTISLLNACYPFLPQYFHPCVAMLCTIGILKIWRRNFND